jgi:hypothetical protein
MRSRTARWSVCAIAVLALGASAFFVFRSEQRIAQRRTALRAFDATSREAASSLADLRAAEQAYVAAGQGVAFWMPKVAALVETAQGSVDTLRAAAASGDAPARVTRDAVEAREAREALSAAAAAIAEFTSADKRARDYIKSGQQLMAADVVFTEGGDTASAAARQVETAGLAEHQAFDTFESGEQKLEIEALSAGAFFAVLMLVLLAPPGRTTSAGDVAVEAAAIAPPTDLSLRTAGPPNPLHPGYAGPPELHAKAGAGYRGGAGPSAPGDFPPASTLALRKAAELCTDFGRVRDLDDLNKLLARAAEAIEASGLIVWVGTGTELRPVIAHGYPPQTLARMPSIARAADNAAAAAYRSGAIQIVLARPGSPVGAVVAPLLSADGCIGALTAEINGGAETSDPVQSLAAIFAAQLAGVIAASAASAASGNSDTSSRAVRAGTL